MDKKTFLKEVRGLAAYQQTVDRVDELLDINLGCEGFVGKLIGDYGDLILRTTSGGKHLSDRIYENFWDCIVSSETWDDEDIEDLYKEII